MATAAQAVLDALDVFSRAPDKDQLERANAWLQDFQHSVNTFRLLVPPAAAASDLDPRVLPV